MIRSFASVVMLDRASTWACACADWDAWSWPDECFLHEARRSADRDLPLPLRGRAPEELLLAPQPCRDADLRLPDLCPRMRLPASRLSYRSIQKVRPDRSLYCSDQNWLPGEADHAEHMRAAPMWWHKSRLVCCITSPDTAALGMMDHHLPLGDVIWSCACDAGIGPGHASLVL